ncbi:hypothetical protein [Glycomyces sp. NPDC021274]|uniref:hypothetical protein n=1 Tax=Glycomyces sp. NPDC021274 TaxID=3155120 RepID=UPI0033D8E908
MPEPAYPHTDRWTDRLQRLLIAASITVFTCAGCAFTGEDRAQGPETTAELTPAEADPWALDGPNPETPLADITVEAWAALMEVHGVTALAGSADEAAWVGTAPDGATVSTSWNGDGQLTEVICSASAQSIEEALATVEICYTSVAVEGFDPVAAGGWLDDRASDITDSTYVHENEAFGPVGLILLASQSESGEYLLTLTLRPTGL